MFPTAFRAGQLLCPALLALCGLNLAAAQTSVVAGAAPAAAGVPVQQAQVAPGPNLSRLAVELSGAVGGRLYRCPPALSLPAPSVCLYVRGNTAELQSRIAAQPQGGVRGGWEARGLWQTLRLVGEAAGTAVPQPGRAQEVVVSLLDLGEGDHLLVLSQEQPALPTPVAPTQPGEVALYVTPADLIGVVRVQALGGQNYRLTPQGGPPADLRVGQRELTQHGKVTPLPLPLREQGGELYIPISTLRAIGCVLTPTDSALTVACGRSSVGTAPRRL